MNGVFQSTHPRRVRRDWGEQDIDFTFISIHAPAKGATNVSIVSAFLLLYFNPRTREGCDELILYIKKKEPYFNPRTREGCDEAQERQKRALEAFQSTHPRRVRQHFNKHCKVYRQYFNPRTREGCDQNIV